MLNNTPYNVQLTLQFNEHLQYTLHLLVSIASLCSNPAIWQVVEHIGTEDNGLNSNTQSHFQFQYMTFSRYPWDFFLVHQFCFLFQHCHWGITLHPLPLKENAYQNILPLYFENLKSILMMNYCKRKYMKIFNSFRVIDVWIMVGSFDLWIQWRHSLQRSKEATNFKLEYLSNFSKFWCTFFGKSAQLFTT